MIHIYPVIDFLLLRKKHYRIKSTATQLYINSLCTLSILLITSQHCNTTLIYNTCRLIVLIFDNKLARNCCTKNIDEKRGLRI